MSFLAKTDIFSMGSSFVVTAFDENNSANTATAQNEKGDVVAEEMYGEKASPTCNYVVKSQATLSGKQLGGAGTTYDTNKHLVLTNLAINTQAANPPAVTCTGTVMPSTASVCSSDCYYSIPTTSLDPCHHAQDLFGLSISLPSGYYLTGANYEVGCDLTEATKDGGTVCWDVTNGKVTAQVTIQGTGIGTLAASSVSFNNGTDPTDWHITSPLTQTNPDAGYDTYAMTFTKNLTHPAAQSGQ